MRLLEKRRAAAGKTARRGEREGLTVDGCGGPDAAVQ